MRIAIVVLFLLGLLFFIFSLAVVVMTSHPYFDYLEPSKYSIESMRFYSARLDIYFTPALFPRYLYFEKEEVDMAKAFDIRNPYPTVVPYELKLTETYERYIPFDTLFLAVLFFGLAFRKVQKPKKFN